ncbi:glycine zipper 2TM domain-containing protein, partial [Bordetella pertussis]
EAANVASAPQQAPKQAQKPAQSAQPAQQPAQAGAPACATCGVVEGIRTVQVPVRDDSNHLIGTVAGGVVGGVVGNQFGGGHGRDALTVLGAVGGALAGREVERNIREQQTVTHYELTVRMSDGSRRQFRSAQPFAFASGDRVRVENDQLLPG